MEFTKEYNQENVNIIEGGNKSWQILNHLKHLGLIKTM